VAGTEGIRHMRGRRRSESKIKEWPGRCDAGGMKNAQAAQCEGGTQGAVASAEYQRPREASRAYPKR